MSMKTEVRVINSSFLVPVLGGIALASGSYYCLLHILNPSSVVGSIFYMTIGVWTLLLCYWDQVDRHVRLLVLPVEKGPPLTIRYRMHCPHLTTCIDLLINNGRTNSRSINSSMDWTRVLSCLLGVYLSFTVPKGDPDVSRLLIESLPFEGDLCVHSKLQDSSTQPSTVMARTAEYVRNLITSGLWTTDNDRPRIVDSTSSSSYCYQDTGRLIPVVPRRRDRYYLLLASIIFKYSYRL